MPLIVSCVIYVFFRDADLLYFEGFLGFENELNFVSSISDTLIWDVIIYSLPDGLWVYSWTVCMMLIWRNEKKQACGSPWAYVGVICGVLFEVFQFFGLLPGTFDLNDVLISLLLFLMAIVNFRKLISKSVLRGCTHVKK